MADTQSTEKQGSGKQGFASMDPDKQKEIASQGGQASHSGSESPGKSASGKSESGGQGGRGEQHAQAGSQSHKNQ